MLKKIARLFHSERQTSHSSGRARRGHSISTRSTSPYACVEIKTRYDHCKAIEQYCGKRLLTEEAPWLPVTGCTCDNCRCSYIRYDDRRTDQRRDIDIGISRREFIGEDRRSHIRGRRKADLTPA